jgi:release factor glutamine methyltransferase
LQYGAPSLEEAIRNVRYQLGVMGVDEVEIEAELMVREAIGSKSRAYLYAHMDEELPVEAAQKLDEFIARRLNNEPLAYIVGHREFFNVDLKVTPATLIPRPETETLVETAIELVNQRQARYLQVAEIGTGSGAIAIALAVVFPELNVVATDVSEEALAVARQNATRNGVADSIDFLQGDLFEPLQTARLDLIIANLPYVTSADLARLEPEIRDWEPHGALDGGEDGLDVIRRLLTEVPPHLNPGGVVALEFGVDQADALMEFAKGVFPDAKIEVRNDLAGRPRVLVVQT